MAMHESVKNIKTIDDFFTSLGDEEKHKEVEAAFDAIDKFSSDSNQNHLYNNVLTPAFDELYNAFVSALDREFKDDDAKLHNKKEHLKRAAVEALKKFFEKIKPSVLANHSDVKDLDDLYQGLTKSFSVLYGAKENLIDDMLKAHYEPGGDDTKTVGDLKRFFDTQRYLLKGKALERMGELYSSHHLTHHDREKVMKYAIKQVKAKGYEISNRGKFGNLDVPELYQIVKSGIPKGKWGIDPESKKPFDPGHYGLKYTKGKK